MFCLLCEEYHGGGGQLSATGCDYYGEQHIFLSSELLFLDLYHGVEHFQAAQNAHVRCTFDSGFRENENHQTETQIKICLYSVVNDQHLLRYRD